jgi:hypothetical protein
MVMVKTWRVLLVSLTNFVLTQVKVDGPGRRRPKVDEDYWLEGEGRE